ncbi:MAG: hypothetical protein ABL903_16745 [Methylococcales bacterium]
MFKVIKGSREQLEAEALRAIWLSNDQHATELLNRLKRKPHNTLQLVNNGSKPCQPALTQEID